MSDVQLDGRPVAPARPDVSDVAAPAPVPRRGPQVGWVGMLLALLLAGLGALLIYEALVQQSWLDGRPLVTTFLEDGIRIEPDGETTALAVLLTLVGLWLLWIALKPGRRKGVRLATHTGVWTTRADLERLVVGAARDVDGVLDADAQVGTRRARLSVDVTDDSVRQHVTRAVEERLSILATPPRVEVRTRPRHGEVAS